VWTEVSKYKYQVALCFLGNLVQRLLLRLFARALLSSRLFSKAAFAFQQRRTTLSLARCWKLAISSLKISHCSVYASMGIMIKYFRGCVDISTKTASLNTTENSACVAQQRDEKAPAAAF
jgi:hypothetical protein